METAFHSKHMRNHMKGNHEEVFFQNFTFSTWGEMRKVSDFLKDGDE